MNTQPKFKNGDMVRVIGGIHKGEVIKYSSDHLALEVMCEDCFSRFWYESDLELLESHTLDMLAIPDDHVFKVEWKEIYPNEKYIDIIAFNKETHSTWNIPEEAGNLLLDLGYTHYLTEADLLKLPFQQ